MRIVYNAESIIDAHLVRHALEAEEIACFVSGEYLSGGIGEIPASGLVAVHVADEQWQQARAVVDALALSVAEMADSEEAESLVIGLPGSIAG